MKKEVITYLSGRFVPAIVNLAVVILAIRYLGPVEYGRYSLLLYTVLITVTLTFHGIQVSILKFLGHASRENQIADNRFYTLTFFSAIISTLIVVLVGVFYFHLLTVELGLVALFTFLNHFYLFHMAVLQVHHRNIRNALMEGMAQVVTLVVLLTGLFFFRWHAAPLMFLALAGGLAGALLLRLITRVKGLVNLDRTKLYWDARFVGKVFDYGYGLALWLFFSHLIMAADRFVLTGYLGYHDSGSYAAIKDLISKAVIFTTLPIYLSYQSKIADRWHSHHKEEAWSVVKEAISFQVLVCILVFIVFMVIKSMIISRLLNIPEMEQWGIYLPLLIGGFLWQTALLLQRFMELFYKPLYMLVAIGACALINIVLNLVIIPYYGIVASPVIMLGTAMLYTGFLSLLLVTGRKRLLE